jgi:hypothetical protein
LGKAKITQGNFGDGPISPLNENLRINAEIGLTGFLNLKYFPVFKEFKRIIRVKVG